MAYKIKIEPQVFDDIQEAIDYYNKEQKGLGKKFLSAVNKTISAIKLSPFFRLVTKT